MTTTTAATTKQPPRMLIAGHGGSGTKRVFNLLDLSPETHCHVAHQDEAGSVFADFSGSIVLTDDAMERLEAGWNDAIDHIAGRLSRYDHLPPPPKTYHYALARRLGLWRLVGSKRLRQRIGSIVPSWCAIDWPLPALLGDRSAMRDAPLVVKMNKIPGWVSWVLAQRPDTSVVHVVRHPGGYLHAWRDRFLSRADAQEVRGANQARLREIAEKLPAWAERFGAIDAMSVFESELWFWRYSTETISEAALGCSAHQLVLDHEVMHNPMSVAERLYEQIGLPVPERVVRWLDQHADDWRTKSSCWRDLLTNEETGAVEQVLAGSPMQRWWRDDQPVSLYTYTAFQPAFA